MKTLPKIELQVSRKTTSRGQRLVVAIAGAVEHRDTINTNSARARCRFVAALAAKLNRPSTDFPTLDAELMQAADEADAAAAVEPNALDQSKPNDDQRPSQATRLVQLALERETELFLDTTGDPFARVAVGEHWETHRVRSRPFKDWLARLFYEATQRTPSGQALNDACTVLEGNARHSGQVHDVPLRVAEHEGAVIVDLGGSDWQAARINAQGWSVVSNPPVRFRRAKAMQPLPIPQRGGSLTELRQFVNVSDLAWPLLLGWLVAALRPQGPYPLLCLAAEQGAGKSTAARLVRSLVDPNRAPLRSEPRDARDLVIAANNGWVIALDNLSAVPGWLSDALCRLSTGGGFSTRELYSDGDEVIFDAMRPAVLTGIEELATRGDLLERCLLVSLPTIRPEQRRTEAELMAAFEAARPRILGALFDAVSMALRRWGEVRLPTMPRMADFAVWVSAAEPALGLEPGAFLAAYQESSERSNESALEASPLAPVLRELAQGSGWSGTATDLLAELEQRADERTRRQRLWPSSARALSGQLRRLAPNLRAAGVDVSDWREPDRGRRRMWALCSSETIEPGRVQTVHSVQEDDQSDPFADEPSDRVDRKTPSHKA